MAIGVAFREQRLELRIFDQPERLVVALPLLVLDDADLVGEILLRNGAEQMKVLTQIETLVKAGAEFLAVTKGAGVLKWNRGLLSGFKRLLSHRSTSR